MEAGSTDAPRAEARRHVFVVLDGIRGVAALSVLTWHAPEFFGQYALFSSYLAVDLFFVLSGFVIAHAYEERLHEGLSPRRFMMIRLIRLYPLYLVGTTVGVVVAGLQLAIGRELIWTPQKLLVAVPLALLFLPTPGAYSRDNDTFPLNGPSWSLFFELAVNLLYAVIAKRLTDRVLIAIVAASAVFLVACGLHYGSLDVGFRWEHIWGGLGRVCFSFFAGILAYRLWRRRRPRLWVPIWLLVPCLVAIFAMRPQGDLRTAFDLAAALIAFPVMVYVCAAATASGLVAKAYLILGVTSYGIYVLHWPLTRLAVRVMERVAPNELPAFIPWAGAAFALALIVFVWVLDRRYDRPLRSALMRLTQGGRKGRPASIG